MTEPPLDDLGSLTSGIGVWAFDLFHNDGRPILLSAKQVLNATHGKLVFGRRVRVLSDILATTFPKAARVLDVGTGDGSIALNIKNGARTWQSRASTSSDGRQRKFRSPYSTDAISHLQTAHSTASCSSTYFTIRTTPACSCAKPHERQQ